MVEVLVKLEWNSGTWCQAEGQWSLTSIWASLLSRYWIIKASWADPWPWTAHTVRHKHNRRTGTSLPDMICTIDITVHWTSRSLSKNFFVGETFLFWGEPLQCTTRLNSLLKTRHKQDQIIHVTSVTVDDCLAAFKFSMDENVFPSCVVQEKF